VKCQLQPGRWRRPLTMGYQTSETHEEFRAQPGISEPSDPAHNPRGFLIDGHLKDGPSQVTFFQLVFATILFHRSCIITVYLYIRQVNISLQKEKKLHQM